MLMAGVYTQKRFIPQPGQDVYGRYKVFTKVLPWRDDEEFTSKQLLYPQTTTSYRDRDPNGDNGEIDPRQLLSENRDRVLRPHDTGHEFETRRGSHKVSFPRFDFKNPAGVYWRGPLLISIPGDDFYPTERDFIFSPVDLQYGTKAIAATRPTKSAANVSQLLLETLRDLPRLPGMSFANGRLGSGSRNGSTLNQSGLGALGSEYLNLVFGWQPTVNDVLKICRAIVYQDDIIKQYIRDSGRNVRRRFEFDVKRESRVIAVDSSNVPAGMEVLLDERPWNNIRHRFFPTSDDARGIASLTEDRTEKYWFSGAYTYYLQDVLASNTGMGAAAQIARKLLGIDGLTVDLMWELAPWTWLIDYFANVGDILSNATAFNRDSLVLRYGYLCRETRVTRTYTHSGVRFLSGPTGPFTNTERFVQKSRVKATPYGFGLAPSGFSPTQWAILVALGMSDGNKNLL
jgi:hypothetical protein